MHLPLRVVASPSVWLALFVAAVVVSPIVWVTMTPPTVSSTSLVETTKLLLMDGYFGGAGARASRASPFSIAAATACR